MHYEGDIIRPPSEADSILLQVTTGCSHNRCAFCGAYPDKRFSIKPDATVDADIDYAATRFPGKRRLFLCDGDALIIPQDRLTRILRRIRERMPRLRRVGTYASAKAPAMKSDAELAELRELGLSIVYMGLESGDDTTLARMGKYGTGSFIVEQGRRAKQAGMKLNVTVLLGLGGRERSLVHAHRTGEALSAVDPDQAAALSLMLVPGTPLHSEAAKGRFEMPNTTEILMELRELLAHTNLTRGLFLADHASNYLPLRIRLPKDKEETLALIDEALAGNVPLRPEFMRGL